MSGYMYRENVNMNNIMKARDQGKSTYEITHFSLFNLLNGFWIMLIRKQNLPGPQFSTS